MIPDPASIQAQPEVEGNTSRPKGLFRRHLALRPDAIARGRSERPSTMSDRTVPKFWNAYQRCVGNSANIADRL